MSTAQIRDFRQKVAELDRDEIIDLIREQDPELVKQIRRIEWVFENKLTHLTDSDGKPIEGRPLTNEELALILDPPFMVDRDLLAMDISIEQQEQIHIASDIVLWAKAFLNAKPRVYQILMLRDPVTRKVFRLGRRMGKTWSMAVMLLHYAYTNKNGRCLVMAPMKSQVALIYEEAMKLAREGEVEKAITRNVASPQHEIAMSTGSTIRFFTTGMKSGAKSDVARGQEAHIIILDEMDYMGIDDLDALLAMMQKTDENQQEKILIGASTPTGRREKFYNWCTTNKYFKEFYFPAYANPLWTSDMEEEMRDQYSEMAYRHEIEADWGEDVEGVYPRQFVDQAFLRPGWDYIPMRTSASSVYLMGVDWDKYGAGPNICVLEVCAEDHEDDRFAGRIRVAFREEIPRGEYVLTKAVQRVIELNEKFNPKWIYVDRGYGETQCELLHRYGVEHPSSGLKRKVKGVSFAETFEMRDPATKQQVKKEMKPFMVDSLRSLLEEGQIVFPELDEELYLQLISYVVVRTSSMGRPIFGASGSQVDHAHDALILACLAYTQNYSDLMKLNLARHSRSISNDFFMPFIDSDDSDGDPRSPNRRVISEEEKTTTTRRRRKGVPRTKRIERKKF